MQGYDNLDCDDNVRKNSTFIAGQNYSRQGIHFYFSIPRYAGEYVPDGRQFIVVAGNINYETVQVKLSHES